MIPLQDNHFLNQTIKWFIKQYIFQEVSRKLKLRRLQEASKIVYGLKIQREVHTYDNIIKFYGITTEIRNDSPKKYMLVMEYANSACAVLCLHEENIIHRDLHSSNVTMKKFILNVGKINQTIVQISKR
ncbi:unnamed protein product [Rhizophagus irregularis]|nr:unnamed protein product [Rhizophagus irregularis]